jgi:hypothetical protein
LLRNLFHSEQENQDSHKKIKKINKKIKTATRKSRQPPSLKRPKSLTTTMLEELAAKK